MFIPENKGDLIQIGNSGINVEASYGISNEKFITMYYEINKKYGLRIEHPYCCETVVLFVLHIWPLFQDGYDLTNLIYELNYAQKKSQDDISHALSLAIVCYHYHFNGDKVEVIITDRSVSSPDLSINGITCDVKVRKSPDSGRVLKYLHLIKTDPALFNQVMSCVRQTSAETMQKTLENRAEHGFHQADALIFNLSQLFNTWTFHRIKKYSFSENPIPPIKDVAVMFSPNIAKDLNRNKLTYEARWFYALWNPEMREYQLALPL